jgi:hypothetical protein
MTETTTGGGGRRTGRPAKYPWDTWLDGEEHRLMHGRDFTGDPHSVRQQVLNEAGRRGVAIQTTLRRASDESRTWWLRIAPGDHRTRRTARGRDWDAIFTRKTPTMLQQGVHFDCTVDSMRVQAYQAAARRGITIATEVDFSRVIIKPQRPARPEGEQES